ncbi:DUF2591 domain-containing protein [Morganella morganii]|uniref:DUF2591 domain-containing protein n=1 Tax=Morganella morganii TaxID=582 RepID=UPI0021D2942B|nr:DUF2591 domain-containing protein [Morganella morganii]MCU6235478.1 DUF2591 domain-containing protein [Morganella morganii]
MNKYRDKSDFEINKDVAIAIGFPCYYGDGSYTNGLGLRAAVVKGKNINGNYMVGGFDPCNNPADAMPIIIENGISLISDWNEIGVWGATCHPWVSSENKNPLRAAMEVFLMMKNG